MGIWDIYGSEEVKMMDFSKRGDGDFHGVSMGFQGFYVVFIQTGVGSEKMVLHQEISFCVNFRFEKKKHPIHIICKYV